jgi:hypothetical protein
MTISWTEERLFDVPPVSAQQQVDLSAQVREVFDYWVSQCRPNHRVRPVLSPERDRKIRKALETHGLEVCLAAIDGVLRSDWHMGRNPRAKEYNDISLVLRDAKHIEMFAERSPNARNDFLDEE